MRSPNGPGDVSRRGIEDILLLSHELWRGLQSLPGAARAAPPFSRA